MAGKTTEIGMLPQTLQTVTLVTLMLALLVSCHTEARDSGTYTHKGLLRQLKHGSRRHLIENREALQLETAASAPLASCPGIDKARLDAIAKDNTLLVSSADHLVAEAFGINWVRNVEAAGITYWVLGALDPQASFFFGGRGVKNCFNSPFGGPLKSNEAEAFHWGSPHWNAALWKKVHLVNALVHLGFNVIFSDIDVTWLRDPLHLFTVQQASYDFLTSTDNMHSANIEGDDGVEVDSNPFSGFNTGIFYLRSSNLTRQLMRSWLDLQRQGVMEQQALNIVTRGGGAGHNSYRWPLCKKNYADPRDPAMMCMNETLRTAQLPISTFMHSYSFYIARLHQVKRVQPYEVHWVWSGNGLYSKRMRMRDATLYYDEPEYYSQGMFLSMELDVPPLPEGYNSWIDTERMVSVHLHALQHQMSQLYYGFALALATNRTLVLPRLQCYCAKNWYMTERCRILRETATQFPFNCSLGDFIKPRLLADGLQVQDRITPVREHSFLDNPRTPPAVKRSVAVVKVQGATPAQAAAAGLPPQLAAVAQEAWVAGLLDEEQVAAQLSAGALGSTRVLHVMNASHLFGDFRSGELKTDFEAKMDHLPTYWCCRSPQSIATGLAAREQLKIRAIPRRAETFRR